MSEKMVAKLTRQYVAKLARIERLEAEAQQLKSQIVEIAPQGADTPHGKWTPFAEGVRLSYSNADVQKLVDKLILEGNSVAVRILELRKESITASGMRFVKAKSE